MKNYKIFFIIVELLICMIILGNWPVEKINELNLVTDITTSWRGDSLKWHNGIDIPVDTTMEDVRNLVSGKVYWNDDTSLYYSYIIIGYYNDTAYCYGHVISELIEKTEIDTTDSIIGKIYEMSNYPHLHFEGTSYLKDTLDWYKNTLMDPIILTSNQYPLNLEKPMFFWCSYIDVNNKYKKLLFLSEDSKSKVIYNYDSPTIIYGNIKSIVTVGSATGIWNDSLNYTNEYNPLHKVSIDSMFGSKSYYSIINPQISDIYNLGYRVDKGNIWWQKNNEYWGYEYQQFEMSDTIMRGLYYIWKKPFPPLSYYIFTNIDTTGHLYVNNKSTINQKHHWSTNIKEGIKGFYTNNETNISKKNREAKYKDGLHWVYVYASNYPTTDINDTEHIGIDSVPVILDNYYPAITPTSRIIIDGEVV